MREDTVGVNPPRRSTSVRLRRRKEQARSEFLRWVPGAVEAKEWEQVKLDSTTGRNDSNRPGTRVEIKVG